MRYVVNLIEEFVIKYDDFDFSRYNMDTESISGKAFVVRAYDEMCERFKAFLINDKKLGDHSITNTITMTIFLIKEMCEEHGINISQRYLQRMRYTSSRNRIVVTLSPEQFEWLLSNELTLRHDNRFVRNGDDRIDYIVAALLTGARFGDLNKITINNLIDTGSGYVLSYVPNKTRNSSAVKVEIPIHDRLVKIFLRNADRYSGSLLNPAIRDMSRRVKQIIRKYPVFQNSIHTQDPRGNIVVKPFWMAMKFHSLRASLITYLLSRGEQETVIKSISGHTLDSTSFKAYTNITNAMKQKAVMALQTIGAE